MKWMERLNENIKKTVRSWLNVLPANPFNFQVNEMMDFEGHAILNRIWYRGDGNELEQIYQQNAEFADKHKFWASRSTPGMDMRKIHTGLPGLTVILDLLAVAGDVIKGITDILGGFIDFCTGVFTNDFSKCWQGIEEILQGFKIIATSIFDFAKKYIFQPFIDYVKGIFRTDWSQSFGLLGTVLNTFLESVKRIWGDAKTIFNGIITFIKGTFHGNWKQAWSGIKDIFKGIFDSLVTLAKTPLNAVIDIINNLMHKLNSGLSAIENAFSFSYDFTNPITGTRHYGHYGMSLPRVPTIPHLANGGYVKPNTPQLAMIGDNLHQGEVVAPEDKLKKMAIEAALAAGGTGVSKAELESIINRAVIRIVAALTDMGFYLDSTQIAKATQEAKAAMDIRYNSVEVK